MSRDELFVPPEEAIRAIRAFGTVTSLAEGEDEPEIVFPLRAPETIDRDIRQLKRLVRDDLTTIILCDNEGQCERLDELLNDGEYAPSPAHLSIGVLDGGFVLPSRDMQPGLRILTDHEIFRRERRIRRARKYVTGIAIDTLAIKPGDFVVSDQFIDRTFAREKSFFGPGFVAHVSLAHPVCSKLNDALAAANSALHSLSALRRQDRGCHLPVGCGVDGRLVGPKQSAGIRLGPAVDGAVDDLAGAAGDV